MNKEAKPATPSSPSDTELLELQREVLELVARGAESTDALNQLCVLVDRLRPNAVASVLILDAKSGRLRGGAGPNVPQACAQAFDGITPGVGMGSCGTAAYTGRITIVEDTRTDPRWAELRDVAEEFQIGACWSIPILASDASVLGTFAVSHPRSASPSDAEIRLLETASHLGGIILERAQLQSAVEDGESRLRVVTEQVPAVIWSTDAELTLESVTGANPSRLFSSDHGAGIGKLSDGVPQLARAHREALDGDSVRCDFQANGRRWEAQVEPIRRRDGIVGTVGVAIDVTERHDMEAQLRQSQKLEAVGLLASGVAHDFNNILMAIQGQIELLDLESVVDERDRRRAGEILKATGRATALVKQLMAYGKRQPMNRAEVDLSTFVRESEPELRRLASERSTLELDLADEPCVASTNRVSLEQVLTNLVINARDAIPGSGGTITVRTWSGDFEDEDGERHPCAYLSVSDTGPGIPLDQQKSVFEPFFTTKPGRGTGLGLAIVGGVAREFGGRVALESAPGRGATFTVGFPLDDVSSRAEADRSRRVRVLVCDDDPSVLSVTEQLLTRDGYRVHTALSGEEALQKLDELHAPVDLLLTDLVLPGLDGAELAARFLERRAAPVVVMSGHVMDDAETDRIAGLGTFLPKPFVSKQLLTCVRDALARTSAAV